MKTLIPKVIDGRVVIINKSDYDTVKLSVNEIEDVLDDVFQKGKIYAFDECIESINDLNIEYAYPHTICNILVMLKEQNNE